MTFRTGYSSPKSPYEADGITSADGVMVNVSTDNSVTISGSFAVAGACQVYISSRKTQPTDTSSMTPAEASDITDNFSYTVPSGVSFVAVEVGSGTVDVTVASAYN